MLERKEALQLILKNCSEKFEQLGFTTDAVCENGEEAYVDFIKDDITIRLLSHDNLLDVTEKAGEGDFVKVESNLLDLEAYEEKDIKSLSNEIVETVSSSYGKKARQAAKKAPQTISKTAAKILGTDFDVEIVEAHHNQKIDAPSGTAIMLGNAVKEMMPDAYFEYDRHSKREKRHTNEIGIHSVRGGTIVGEHEVIFAGNDEIVKLSHSARSKAIFAQGAVNAAAFLNGKENGIYNMTDLVNA